MVARHLRQGFDQSVERSGVTRAKWTLIAAVARIPGATQRKIAEALEVKEITAGRLIDRFGPRKLILPSTFMVGLILLSTCFCSGLSLLSGLASRCADVKQAIVAAAKLNDDLLQAFFTQRREPPGKCDARRRSGGAPVR